MHTGGFMLWNAAGLYTPQALHSGAAAAAARRCRRPSSSERSLSWRAHGRDARNPPADRGSRARGPAAILERKERVVAEPLSVYLPIVVAEGRGATLTDVDGNTFLDFTGGVGCLNVGHAHPHVVEAVQEQAARFLHTDFTIVPYEVYVTLAERLLAVAPFTRPGEGGVLQRRHGSGRERGQVRARVHEAARR